MEMLLAPLPVLVAIAAGTLCSRAGIWLSRRAPSLPVRFLMFSAGFVGAAALLVSGLGLLIVGVVLLAGSS